MAESRADGPIEHPDLAPKAGFTWGRLAVILILVFLVVMWTYIWVFVPRDNPDRFASTAYAEAAEPMCAAIQEQINALPSGPSADSPQERAVSVRAGTELTAQMVAELRALTSLIDDPEDLATLDKWFEDWEEGYLVDRWAHVERLENATDDTPDRELAFLIQDRAEGGFYTRRIDGLANVNDMPSCAVPTDI